MTGVVYIIEDTQGHYKIGATTNVIKRLRVLRVANPRPLYLTYYSDPVPFYKTLEKFVHEKFKSKRMNGEWFSLTDTDLVWFANLCDSIK